MTNASSLTTRVTALCQDPYERQCTVCPRDPKCDRWVDKRVFPTSGKLSAFSFLLRPPVPLSLLRPLSCSRNARCCALSMSTVSLTTTYEGEPFTIPPFPYADLLERGYPFADWRDRLRDDGYAVVKGAIPRDRALEYRERAFQWLESWQRGFDRNDPETFSDRHLPINKRGQSHWERETRRNVADALFFSLATDFSRWNVLPLRSRTGAVHVGHSLRTWSR